MAKEILYVGSSWGDCDDYALMLAAMASSHGYATGFVTMATSPHRRDFRHVFVVAVTRDAKEIYLDPSVTRPYQTGDLRTALWWTRGHRPPRI